MKKNKYIIFQPTKSAMQSGLNNSKKWCLTNVEAHKTYLNSIFCWTGSSNPEKNIQIFFDDLDSAVRFAKSKGHNFEIINTPKRKIIKKSYSNNFIR